MSTGYVITSVAICDGRDARYLFERQRAGGGCIKKNILAVIAELDDPCATIDVRIAGAAFCIVFRLVIGIQNTILCVDTRACVIAITIAGIKRPITVLRHVSGIGIGTHHPNSGLNNDRSFGRAASTLIDGPGAPHSECAAACGYVSVTDEHQIVDHSHLSVGIPCQRRVIVASAVPLRRLALPHGAIAPQVRMRRMSVSAPSKAALRRSERIRAADSLRGL